MSTFAVILPAAGNAAILKPASYTPLTACLLADVLVEAGMPAAEALQAATYNAAEVLGASDLGQLAAEKKIETSGKSPGEIVAWFAGQEPQSAQGATALAWYQLGRYRLLKHTPQQAEIAEGVAFFGRSGQAVLNES